MHQASTAKRRTPRETWLQRQGGNSSVTGSGSVALTGSATPPTAPHYNSRRPYAGRRELDTMVCDKCQTKLGKVIVPDKWKDGARNTTGAFCACPADGRGRLRAYRAAASRMSRTTRATTEGGGRKIGENRLIGKASKTAYGRVPLRPTRRRRARS